VFLYQVVASLIALHTTHRSPTTPLPSTRDRGDEVWGTLMISIGQDLRHSVRTLLKAPGFTLVSVATLAIGIGATSAIFSVVDSVLLTPLPHDRANELVVVAPEGVARPATEALQGVDPDLPVYAVASMREVVAKTVAQRRMLMLLLSLFASQALVLAAIGVYGVIAYATRQRTREIGVRIALGADAAAVVGMILRRDVLLGVVGVVIGLAGAAGLTKVLQSFLFQVGRLDPIVFGSTALLWIALAALAALVPARRGTRVHPVEVLRGG
jgi:hypothetical protein